MLRGILFVLALCAAVPASAQCVGSSFVERLSLRQLADLQASVDTIPYATGNIWQAQKGETTLTILGTMHLPDPRHVDMFGEIVGPRLPGGYRSRRSDARRSASHANLYGRKRRPDDH